MFQQQTQNNVMRLTRREIEIITSVAEGNKQSAIAKLLDISCDTVNFHMDNVRLKLDAKNTVNAVAICIREKIIG